MFMKTICMLMILSFVSATNVLADSVVLMNGNTIQGTIVEQTREYVKIDAGVGVAVTYYYDEIANITKGENPRPSVAPEKTMVVPAVIAPLSSPVAAKLPEKNPIPTNTSVGTILPESRFTIQSGEKTGSAGTPPAEIAIVPKPVAVAADKKAVSQQENSITPPFAVPEIKKNVEPISMEKEVISPLQEEVFSVKPVKVIPEEISIEANKVGNEGIALIQDGKMDEGLALVKRSTEINPDDPSWHMNYGSMLFSMGSSLFKDGSQKESLPVVQEAEKELLWAAKLYNDQKNQNVLESQCYFLLGDIYNFIFQDKAKAKGYYEKTVALYPKHQEANDALKNLGNPASESN